VAVSAAAFVRTVQQRPQPGRWSIRDEEALLVIMLQASHLQGTVVGVALTNGPSTSVVSVSAVGRGCIGGSDSSMRSRIFLSSCLCSLWLSDIGVGCRGTSYGVGAGLAVVVNSGLQIGSLNYALSFGVAFWSAVIVHNVSGIVDTFTVIGCGGYGSSGRSAQVRVGGTACGGSLWLSDSGIVCRGTITGAGAGMCCYDAGLLRGSLSLAMNNFTVDPIMHTNWTFLRSVSASNVPSSGRVTATVIGRGLFGGTAGSARARVGGTACGGSLWVSYSGVVCRGTRAGVGAGLGVVVSSWLQIGCLSFALSLVIMRTMSLMQQMQLHNEHWYGNL